MSNIEKLAQYICEHTSSPKAATEALIAVLSAASVKQPAKGEGDAA